MTAYSATIVADGLAKLSPAFRKPVTQAILAGIEGHKQAFEDAIAGPSGYIAKLPLSVAVGDTLDKYGKIVDYPRGALGDDDYRSFIQVKIAVNRSNDTGDALLGIVSLVSAGPYAVRDFDRPTALDVQAGHTPFALGLIGLLPKARNGGTYATLRYWPWAPTVPNVGTSVGLFVPCWKAGDTSVPNATGFVDLISGNFNNPLAAVAKI